MTLEEFKKIFWLEYFHRVWGRVIGLAFIFPGLYFYRKGWMSPTTARRSLLLGGLIGLQGCIGWLMVKSGLDERIVEEKQVPRVSHYRLAAHLGTAFVIYVGMLWTALDVFSKRAPVLLVRPRALYSLAHAAAGMTFITALSGLFLSTPTLQKFST